MFGLDWGPLGGDRRVPTVPPPTTDLSPVTGNVLVIPRTTGRSLRQHWLSVTNLTTFTQSSQIEYLSWRGRNSSIPLGVAWSHTVTGFSLIPHLVGTLYHIIFIYMYLRDISMTWYQDRILFTLTIAFLVIWLIRPSQEYTRPVGSSFIIRLKDKREENINIESAEITMVRWRTRHQREFSIGLDNWQMPFYQEIINDIVYQSVVIAMTKNSPAHS